MDTPQSDSLQVVSFPNRFDASTRKVVMMERRPELTIAHYTREMVKPGYVTIYNGKVISPEECSLIIPKTGDQIIVAAPIPAGGDHGENKGILRTIGMIAVMVASIAATFFLGPALFGAGHGFLNAMLGAGIAVGGGMLVNWATSVRPAELTESTSYGWNGPQMSIGQGTPIQRGYGKFGCAPKPISSYVYTVGNKQYLNILGSFGFGPAKAITNVRINDQPIQNYKGVIVEKRMGTNNQNPIWFFNDLYFTRAVGQRIRVNETGIVSEGQNDCDAIEVELNAPKGLWAGPNTDGSYDPWAVLIKIETKPHAQPDTAYSPILQPRTTAAVDGTNYWIALSNDQSMGPQDTGIVLAQSNVKAAHYEGEPYTEARTVTPYDQAGTQTTAKTITLKGTWTKNPLNSEAEGAQQGGTLSTVATWTAASFWMAGQGGSIAPTEAKRAAFRLDHLTRGKYDVRVTKVASAQRPGETLHTDKEDDKRRGEEVWVASIKEIQYEDLAYPNMILLGVRALATEQLSGAGLNITAEVEWETPATVNGTLLEGYACSNPAVVAWDILTNTLYGGGVPIERLDQHAFKEYADWCNEVVPVPV